jgi:5'-deoxynucleotidase YfbR-like HD superfamily hydrolase
MKTAKREAEDKIKEAEDNLKEMRKKVAESDEDQVKVKRELSGLRQAWGISNSTKDKEIRMIKKADELRLHEQVERAERTAFEEGEESGHAKYQKAAQIQAEKQQQLFAQGQLSQA